MRDQDESDNGAVPRPTQRGWSGDHPAPGSRTGSIVVDRYRIGRLLGRGGMGEVYEAQHLVIGRRFAIKFVRTDLKLDERVMQRFTREAQAAGRLDHENIAAVFDLGNTPEGYPFIVLEYLDGEDLSRMLTRGLPAPPVTAALVRQAALGLHAAHERGIVHRDLKPANLFVCRLPDGASRIKVLDFGIAKLQVAGVQESLGGWMPTGTPQYMSPEQAAGRRPVDRRIDVYALGAIMYEALSGRRPHAGEDYQATLRSVLERTPVSLASLRPDLPVGIVEIVERAMARDPQSRYATAEQMAQALRPFGAVNLVGAAGAVAGGPIVPAASTPLAGAPAMPPSSSPVTRATDYTSDGGSGSPASLPSVHTYQTFHRNWVPWIVAATCVAAVAAVTALLVSLGRVGAEPPPQRPATAMPASSAPAPAASPTPPDP